jgi:multiple sugar transport system substrate-binding protein
MSRSAFLRFLGLAGASTILAACSQAAPASPTAAPAAAAAPAAPTATTAAAAPAATPTPAAQAAAAPAGAVELTVAHAWEAAFLPTQQSFDQQFSTKNPGVTVKIINNTWPQHNQVVPTWASSHTLPDLLYIHGSRIQPWAALGMLVPIDSYLQSAKDFNLDDFFKIALILYNRKGKYYALPYDNGPIIVAYNADLFQTAGVKPPDESTTMDDLRTMAKQLTKSGQQWGIDRLLTGSNEGLIARVGPWGGQVMDDNETKTMINTDESATALQWWADILLKDKSAPSPAESQAIQGGPWLAGKVALYPSATWDTPTFHANAKFNWDVAPWPKGSKGQKTGAFGSGYGITTDSKHPDQGWTYLASYLSKDGMEFMWGKSGRGSPARKSAYQSFLDSATAPKHAKFFEDAQNTYADEGRPYTNLNAAQVLDILNRETDQVLRGTKTAKQAVQDMQTQADPVLADGAK